MTNEERFKKYLPKRYHKYWQYVEDFHNEGEYGWWLTLDSDAPCYFEGGASSITEHEDTLKELLDSFRRDITDGYNPEYAKQEEPAEDEPENTNKVFTVAEIQRDRAEMQAKYRNTGCMISIECDWFSDEINVQFGWYSSDSSQKVEDAVLFAENFNKALADAQRLEQKYAGATFTK